MRVLMLTQPLLPLAYVYANKRKNEQAEEEKGRKDVIGKMDADQTVSMDVSLYMSRMFNVSLFYLHLKSLLIS